MKMNKRFLSLALAFVMVLGSLASLTPVLAAETAVELSDIDGHWAEAHIKKAVEEGLVKGYKDGTFKPGNSLARAEMATILARAFELETEADLKDFTDVKSTDWFFSAMGMAVEAGIFKGDGDKLMPRENIRRDHAFATVARGLKLEKSEEFNKAFPDLDEMDQSVKGEVAALVNLGYVEGDKAGKLNPAGEITRAEMTKIVNLALGFKVDEPEEKELKVESVSAINAKELKVTFNKAVDDTKAVFEVKKGSVKVNTSKVTFNEAKTEAVVELSGKLSKGEYTVNVTGLSEEVLTGTVTVENETVASVEILSENAAIVVAPGSGTGTVTVGYKVENQYGEDITATTAITATAGGAVVRTGTPTTAVKGSVTIPVNNNAKEGDSIVLTLIHTGTGKSASKTVKVAAKSAVADIAITNLYNKDGKALNETTDLSKDAFYLIVEAKDQYGQALETGDITGLIANNTNPLIAKINGGANPTLETIQVDKKDVAAIKLTGPVSAGETNIMLIAPASGKNASYTVKVAEAERADTIAFEVPSVVPAKENLFVPVQVMSKDGNLITSEKTLNDPARGVSLSGVAGAAFATKNGVLGVSIPSSSLQNVGYVSLVGVTSTAKSTIANIQVKEAASPVIVTGLSKSASTTLLTGGNLPLTTSNVVVEDQYGREMTKAALDAWLAADTTNNKIMVADDSNSTVVTLTNGPAITNGNATVTVNAGSTKGTEKVTLTLANSDNTTGLATSAKEVNFQVTDGTEYASYEVNTIGTVYDELGAATSGITNNAAYDKAVEVYGVLSNGSKVKLTYGTDFSVSSTNATLNTDVSANGEINVASAYTYPTNVTEIKAPITVTINATGEQLTQEVTISKVAPKVTKIEIVKNGDVSNKDMTSVSSISYDAAANGAFDYTQLDAAVDVVVTDQYGVKVALGGSSDQFADGTAIFTTLTFTKVDGSLVFNVNGTTAAAVTEIPANSVFNVIVKAGDLTASTLKVTASSAYSATDASSVSTDKGSLTLTADSSDNVILPSSGSNGTTITWTKAGSAVSGTISVSTGDSLVATVKKGLASDTKTFTVSGASGSLTIN